MIRARIFTLFILLAAVGVEALLGDLTHRWPRGGRLLAGAGGATWACLVLWYLLAIFWQSDPQYQQWQERYEDHPLVELIYDDLPDPYTYFGGPRQYGWKTVGWLMNQGQLSADYRSENEIFSLPIWYTYGTARSCFDDPTSFLVAYPPDDAPTVETLFNRPGYAHLGDVLVENRPRIALFSRQASPPDAPVRYDYEDYQTLFDQQASLNRYTRPEPLAYPLDVRFGELIQLQGFAFSPRAPGRQTHSG